MQDIKLKEAKEKTIKTFDRAADYADHVKKPVLRTAEEAKSFADSEQTAPSEYAGDKLEYATEDIAREAGHVVIRSGKKTYQESKSALRNYREARRAEKNITTPSSKSSSDAIGREQHFRQTLRQNSKSVKAVRKTEKTTKQTRSTAKQSVKTMERSVKGTQKAVKTADHPQIRRLRTRCPLVSSKRSMDRRKCNPGSGHDYILRRRYKRRQIRDAGWPF